VNNQPIIDRTWIDPSWGTKLAHVDAFRPAWMKSDCYGHIGSQALIFAGIFLLLALLNGLMDFVLGKVSLGLLASRIAEPQFLAIILFCGTLIALLHRWLEWRGSRILIGTPQAEIYRNGIYLAPYGFVKGLHPFFEWRDITHIDLSFGRGRVDLALQLRNQEKPGQLVLDAESIAALLDLQEIKERPDSPLLHALESAKATLT
jgi:hypothetical protein